MRLLLPVPLVKRMVAALRRADRHEIGILMGEHVGEDLFRIVECTVQTRGGTASHFVRQPEASDAELEQFAQDHGHDHHRFTYLGERYSYPCHPLRPSLTDIRTMASIVENLETGVNFAVPLLVRLGRAGTLEAAARIYFPGDPSQGATLVLERPVEATDDR